ncbi:hypothetical protein [Nonlabens spongiae]|nr:hypothetical protein [Nonlabens spongiae]
MTQRIILIFMVLLGATQAGHAKSIEDEFEQIDPISQVIAKAYLDSCPQNSLLFIDSTSAISISYLQQVFKYRTDVMIIDKRRLELPSYYDSIMSELEKDSIQLHLPKKILHPQGQITFPINMDEMRVTNLAGLDEHFNNDSLFVKVDSVKIKYFPGRDMGILESDFSFRYKELENRSDLTRQHINWRWNDQKISRGELFALMIISNTVNKRPVVFTKSINDQHLLGLDRFLVQYGLVELLQPVLPVRFEGQDVQKVVITSNVLEQFFSKMNADRQFKNGIPRNFGNSILRPALLNEAKYLLKTGDSISASHLIDDGMKAVDLEAFGITNEVYSIGELYLRLGEVNKAEFLMDAYLTNVIASLEKSFVSTKVAQRKAVNASARQLKTVREIIQAHLAKYPERSDYWSNRLAKLKAKRKEWSQNIDLD